MSRTWKDRRGYKTKTRSYPGYMNVSDRFRGGYDDYDHSDQELYVDDQCCENCRYFCGNGCGNVNREDYNPDPDIHWCEDWKDGGYH